MGTATLFSPRQTTLIGFSMMSTILASLVRRSFIRFLA